MTEPPSTSASLPSDAHGQLPTVQPVSSPEFSFVTPSLHAGQTPSEKPVALENEIQEPRLIRLLSNAVEESDTFAQLIQNLARIVSDSSDCLGLWGLERNEHGDFGTPIAISQPANDALWQVVEDQTNHLTSHSCRSRLVASAPLSCQAKTLLIVAPILHDEPSSETADASINMVLAGCFSTENQSDLRLQWLISFVSQAIIRWQQRQTLAQHKANSRGLKDAFAIIDSLNKSDSVSAASKIMVNHLLRMTNATQVALAIGDTAAKLRMESVSGVEQLDASSESTQAMLAACQQPLLEGSTLSFVAGNTARTSNELALQNYCNAYQLEGCIALGIKTSESQTKESPEPSEAETSNLNQPPIDTFGAILIAASPEQIADDNYRTYVNQLVDMLGGHLALTLRANQSVRQILGRRIKQVFRQRAARIGFFAMVLAAATMLIPLPYRVHCECNLQPIHRRFIAAPYEGILESSTVESGDLVNQNQIIARLDGRQLRMELAGLEADFDGAKKRRESSLANRDVAQSQIARSEMRRHDASIKILKQQLTNLEIRSPIDGVVVSGDLEKAHGAPVEMGQTLFEVAPLEEMVAEVAIPESEIGYVQKGMTVSVKLDAFPFETFTGTVALIHPHAEPLNDQSVFIADVKLTNAHGQLKPGMKGQAKVSTSWAPLGWNLFHRPWESVRYWTVW